MTPGTVGAQRIRFATGGAAAAVREEVAALGGARVMVVASASAAAAARSVTADLPVVLWHDEVVQHVPIAVAQRARAAASAHDVDVLVSVGGGSATGLAKAVALTSGIPVVAVPTTFAGSEVTDVWGLTDVSGKTTGSDPRVLPRVVVYDATLTLDLPVALSVVSGLNAVAHAVDAQWAPRADAASDALGLAGLRALAESLPSIVADPTSLTARELALRGSHDAAAAFAAAGSGLHHKVSHVLGGRYDLPHAETHAVVLPHVVALNAPGAPEAERRLAAALGAASALEGLLGLRSRLGAPTALRDLGLDAAAIPEAAAAVLAVVPPRNPVPVTAADLTRLLENAWEGVDPR